jgi:hypothetical protein
MAEINQQNITLHCTGVSGSRCPCGTGIGGANATT